MLFMPQFWHMWESGSKEMPEIGINECDYLLFIKGVYTLQCKFINEVPLMDSFTCHTNSGAFEIVWGIYQSMIVE